MPEVLATRISKGCKVTSCERMHFARGYCQSHYNRERKYGDPLGSGSKPAPIPSCSTHGGTYTTGCVDCKTVNRMRMREWRRRHPERARENNARSYAKHMEQRKADARSWRERSGKRYQVDTAAVDSLASKAWQRWTPEDDVVVMSELSIRQIAVVTGRTYGAVATRRKLLSR